MASPLTIRAYHRTDRIFEAILKLRRNVVLNGLLSGWPRLMNGDIGRSTESTGLRRGKILSHTQIPLNTATKRLLTVTAQRLKQETGSRQKKTAISA